MDVKIFSIEAVYCQVFFYIKYAAKNAIPLPPAVQNMALSYSSEVGYALISNILARNPTKPVQPHNFQVEGIGNAFDGDDLLVNSLVDSMIDCFRIWELHVTFKLEIVQRGLTTVCKIRLYGGSRHICTHFQNFIV